MEETRKWKEKQVDKAKVIVCVFSHDHKISDFTTSGVL